MPVDQNSCNEIDAIDAELSVNPIPYNKLSDVELQKRLDIMVPGNKLLASWADLLLGTRKRKVFLQNILTGKVGVCSVAFGARKGEVLTEAMIAQIKAVKSIEWDILSGYAALVEKFALEWSKKKHGTYLNADDFCSEGNEALRDAIYGYKGKIKNAVFNTYAWWAISRRMQRAVVNAGPLSSLNKEGLYLHRKYVDLVSKLSEKLNFEQIANRLKLSDEEKEILSAILVRVTNFSQIQKDDKPSRGYLDLGRNVNKQVENLDNQDLLDKIGKVMPELTELEIEAFKQSLEDKSGWQSRVARKFSVTREAARVAALRVPKKIRKEYFDHYAQA